MIASKSIVLSFHIVNKQGAARKSVNFWTKDHENDDVDDDADAVVDDGRRRRL